MPIAANQLEVMQVCRLLQCVREEDRKQIEKLTQNGIPHLINYNDPTDGNTALGVAASRNMDSMLEFLLSLGAHPDVVDFKGRTATMRAAEYGHVECVEKLAQAGANMRLVDTDGRGVLTYCIAPSGRHETCFDICVVHGAEVNNKTKDGGHVLLHACETAKDNEDMCIMLLKKGAEANCRHEKSGRTPLMAASESGSPAVCRELLDKGADVNRIDCKRWHASHYAAMNGHFEVLSILSGFAADFNQTNTEGNTPIHLAAKAGHGNCCKFLVQRGCNPKPKNKKGDTARVIAKEANNKAAVKELRKGEKSFGKVSKNNEPWALLLHDWLTANSKNLLNLFLTYDEEGTGIITAADMLECLASANMPVEDENIQKVLSLYGKTGQIDYQDFLTGKKFVNKNYLITSFYPKKKKKGGKKGRGKAGKFKLVVPICTQNLGPRASDGGPPDVFIERHLHFTDTGRFDRDNPPEHPVQDDSAWYIHHPDRTYINIIEAAKVNDFDSLRDALARGQTLDTRDKFYKTPLMIACATGNMKMVQFLVENRASVITRDNFKWTPLHHAAHSGQLDIVEYLIANGAEIESMAMCGGTPLYRAIESSKVDVVQFLINRGAKMQIENKKGSNPFEVAIAWADLRVLQAVKAKWDSLPPPLDKKKAAAKKKAAKRPKTTDDTARSQASHVPLEGYSQDDMPAVFKRKGSILRAASALAGGLDEAEDITYEPLKPWTEQLTTDQLIHEKEMKRDRFTWEVDFSDFKMPFSKNADERLKEIEHEL